MKIDLIVAAAGRGSRLGSNLPKPLYLINGKPILEVILEKFQLDLSKVIIVISDNSVEVFEDFISQLQRKTKYSNWKIDTIIQDNLNGTLGAIECGLLKVESKSVFVVWGDHIGISKQLVQKMKSNHEQNPDRSLVLPTVMRHNPYVNFKRLEGKIIEFQELKNFKEKTEFGENDCGCFLFDRDSLQRSIKKFNKINVRRGSETNFLELIPYLEAEKSGIFTQVETDIELTMGINSILDIKNYLNKRFQMNIEND